MQDMHIPTIRTMAVAGAVTLWALAASAPGLVAQGAAERAPAAGVPEGRGRSGGAPAPLDEGQQAPTQAPAEPELEAAPGPPAACPDRGTKLELIV